MYEGGPYAMDKIIGVTELQRNFRDVFDEVVDQKTAYILTRGSRPEAVLISYEQYRKFVSGNEQEVIARIERLLERMEHANNQYSDKEVEADLREATQDLRKRKPA
jgi:prevent-host-death family protein